MTLTARQGDSLIVRKRPITDASEGRLPAYHGDARPPIGGDVSSWDYRVVAFEPESADRAGKWQFLEPFGGGYIVVRSEAQLPALLVYAGQEGWELVAAQPMSSRAMPTLFFKRPR